MKIAIAALAIAGCAKESPPVVLPAATGSASALPPAASATQGRDCAEDRDCVAYMDCCGAAFTCGTPQAKKSYEAMCACCVSCNAPTHPAKPVTCACANGSCVTR